MGQKSSFAFWMARHQPGLTRLGLWAWAHLWLIPRKQRPHWLFVDLSNQLRYRVLVDTKLGNGMKIQVPWNDFIGSSILAHGYHEPETVRLIEQLLKPGMVFFDVGAHIGQYTLVAGRLVGNVGQVHSFEPDPETFRCLSNNVWLNRLTNVSLNQLGLNNEKGSQKLYLASAEGTGCNSMAPPSTNYSSGRTLDIVCTTLDEYVDSKKITRVDLMKMDVEGAELLALRGGDTLLGSGNKPIMILEFEEARQQAFGNSTRALYDFFRERGYRLYSLNNGTAKAYAPSPQDPPSLNVLAVPEGKTAGGLVLEG